MTISDLNLHMRLLIAGGVGWTAMRTIPMTFSTAVRTYECQFLGRRSVSTSYSGISADMEDLEMRHHIKLPEVACHETDISDQVWQASYRHVTASIDYAADGRHQ